MNPMYLSICIGGAVLVISIIVMVVWKPSLVVYKDSQNKKQIYWGKLISIAFVLGSVAAIVIALRNLTATSPIIPDKEEVTMSFSNKIYNSF